MVSHTTSSSRPIFGEESLINTDLEGGHNEALPLGRAGGPFKNVPQLVPGYLQVVFTCARRVPFIAGTSNIGVH